MKFGFQIQINGFNIITLQCVFTIAYTNNSNSKNNYNDNKNNSNNKNNFRKKIGNVK